MAAAGAGRRRGDNNDERKIGKNAADFGGIGHFIVDDCFCAGGAAAPAGSDAGSANACAGAQIQLTVSGGQGNEWTKVQWLDAAANQWRNVDGWGGSVDGNGRVLWWVEEENLGRGPFRWQVFDEEGGSLLETSGRFFLPDRAGDLLEVTVSLAP